jgi:hypothetical protein
MPKQILEAEASHAARVCCDRAPVFNFKCASRLLVLFIHYKSFGRLPITATEHSTTHFIAPNSPCR